MKRSMYLMLVCVFISLGVLAPAAHAQQPLTRDVQTLTAILRAAQRNGNPAVSRAVMSRFSPAERVMLMQSLLSQRGQWLRRVRSVTITPFCVEKTVTNAYAPAGVTVFSMNHVIYYCYAKKKITIEERYTYPEVWLSDSSFVQWVTDYERTSRRGYLSFVSGQFIAQVTIPVLGGVKLTLNPWIQARINPATGAFTSTVGGTPTS